MKQVLDKRNVHRVYMGAEVAQSFDEYRREVPIRAADFDSDVSIPVFQSLFGGGLAFGFLAGITGMLGHSIYVAIVFTFLFTLLLFIALLWDARKMLRVVETFINHDLDGDGYVGEPEFIVEEDHLPTIPERPTIFVPHTDGSRGYSVQYFDDLPESVEESLPKIARAIIEEGANFSKPELSTRRKLITQKDYDWLRNKLINSGMAYTLPNNSTHLNRAGVAFLEHYIDIVEGETYE